MSEMIIPDGHRSGQPMVKVSSDIIEQLGPMTVNYDGLDDMYHGEFAVPADATLAIQLRCLNRERYVGAFDNWAKTITIDPVKAYEGDIQDGLTSVLLHESQHAADYFNHRLKFYGRKALLVAGVEAGGAVGGLAGFGGAELLGIRAMPERGIEMGAFIATTLLGGYYFINGYYYRHSSSEKRANKTGYNTRLLDKYEDVINFPERYALPSGTAGGRPQLARN